MMKIRVNEVEVGMLIRVDTKIQSDGSKVTIAAHTAKAAPARVVELVEAGRYLFIVTDMGDVMTGRGGKVTIA